ncbi:BON domain-containing protein [Cupriavidus respiraculi]|uniref:BON domain-containing protein n=1 Tax=Cupriavidus respiraculi TaxID=195930 RepID=UPI001C95C986|nr:BON domain-containing protein [Cupriavidus respiraculi]MBY4947419.1 BON domain-containing protein [Cupriavidus respiraculi]
MNDRGNARANPNGNAPGQRRIASDANERAGYGTENWSAERVGRGDFSRGMEWFPEDERTGEVLETWRHRGYGGGRGARANAHYTHGNPGGVGHGYGEGSYGVADAERAGQQDTPRRPRVWPKGYQRSDERIREEAIERLGREHDIELAQITLDVASGVVTLGGTVQDRRAKRRIEDLVDEVDGVTEIRNDIRVSR